MVITTTDRNYFVDPLVNHVAYGTRVHPVWPTPHNYRALEDAPSMAEIAVSFDPNTTPPRSTRLPRVST